MNGQTHNGHPNDGDGDGVDDGVKTSAQSRSVPAFVPTCGVCQTRVQYTLPECPALMLVARNLRPTCAENGRNVRCFRSVKRAGHGAIDTNSAHTHKQTELSATSHCERIHLSPGRT